VSAGFPRNALSQTHGENTMNFGLLLSHLPHPQESHTHYDAMLALHAHEPRKLAALWQRFKAFFS
jgi:hypothetical protein